MITVLTILVNLRRHIQIKHDRKTRPEMRGRKNKNGTLSERTKYRRKAEKANNLTEREVSWLGRELRVSERDLNKVVKFAKRKSSGALNGNLVEFPKNKKQILKGHFKTELGEFHDKNGKVIEQNLTTSSTIVQGVSSSE